MSTHRHPIVVAHKVNRLGLLKKYLALGVPIIEVDVSLYKGRLVVYHQTDFSDYGTVRGEVMRLGFMLIDQRDPILRPMTLESYLRYVGNKVGIWLDVKSRGVEGEAARLALEMGAPKVIVSSNYHDSLELAKDVDSSVETFLGGVTFRPADPVEMVDAAGADGISIEHRYVDRELVEEVHNAGLAVAAWIVNSEKRARELIDYGCDFIITNVPEKIMPLV